MAETDLSKIVNLIMENPKLIEEIKNLSTEKAETDNPQPNKEEPQELNNKSESITAPAVTYENSIGQGGTNRIRRKDLLLALKPYVSEERGRAIDSMMSIADILEMMRSK